MYDMFFSFLFSFRIFFFFGNSHTFIPFRQHLFHFLSTHPFVPLPEINCLHRCFSALGQSDYYMCILCRFFVLHLPPEFNGIVSCRIFGLQLNNLKNRSEDISDQTIPALLFFMKHHDAILKSFVIFFGSSFRLALSSVGLIASYFARKKRRTIYLVSISVVHSLSVHFPIDFSICSILL